VATYRPVYVNLWALDDKFQDYSVEGKLLFLYLITNDHVSEAGIYKITPKTIANETDIPRQRVVELLQKELGNNVSFDQKGNVVFVHKFLKFNGSGSPDLIQKSISKTRKLIETTLWEHFDKCYTRDLKPIPNNSGSHPASSSSSTKSNAISKKEEAPLLLDLTPIEKEILKVLRAVPGYPYDFMDTITYIRELSVEFPRVDMLEEVKKKATWWKDKPLGKSSNPHLQLRNWLKKGEEWAVEAKRDRDVGQTPEDEPNADPISKKLWDEAAAKVAEGGGDTEVFYQRRCLVFEDKENVEAWLALEGKTAQALIAFLHGRAEGPTKSGTTKCSCGSTIFNGEPCGKCGA